MTACAPRLIVVTGATGFTGPFALRALRNRFPSASLRAVLRPTSDAGRLGVSDVAVTRADLRDEAALDRAFAGADTLVNVASLGFDWTDNVVRAAREAGIRRAVFVGTTAMLTRLPVESKPVRERGERLVRESGLGWTILRPTMIYGTPADRNIARLLRFVRRSPVVPLLSGAARQQPVHVEDVAWAIAAVLATDRTIGRAYNISGRDPITLRALVDEAAAAVGRRPLVIPVPVPPVIFSLRMLRLIGAAPLKTEQVQRLGEDKSFDHDEAARDFGFAPRSFRDGVRAEARLFGVRET